MPSSNKAAKEEIESPLDRVKWPRQNYDDPGVGLPGAIFRHQHPEDCGSARYLLWRFPLSDRDARNIGALYSTLQAWMAYAMQTGRILVFDDRNWKLTDIRCEHRSSLCYFRPISACQIPYKPRSIVSVRKAADVEAQPDDVQVIEFEGAWWPMKATQPFKVNITTPSGTTEVVEALSKPRVLTRWSTAVMQYFWRPHTDLEEKITSVLSQLKPSTRLQPEHTIAMPVRASDKCHGHSIQGSAAGEEDCLELEQYMKVADDIRTMRPEVDTIIFTSESRDMVEQSKKYSIEKGGKWKMIYNTVDVMQGTGSTNTATLKKSKTRSLGIQSALISLHLQLRAKYFVVPYHPRRHRTYSSWLHTIGGLSRSPDITFVETTHIVDVHRGKWYQSDGTDEEYKQ
eukprot:CAMPEP_0167781702 /NCGR_PEP_ID=MMETSP0111_2-20121227/6081_1 /TAXON_ID=91324 /ORGANISM="Lotharella globosa, Strain CCCM811" /LENGTH=398 /DNA_ID=CAMNT_0007672397 /DNA_START=173 /DNA_END=1369 /DNA_ORIENTATION=-